MPLVRVDAVAADPQQLTAIGDALHAALVDAFGIPSDDRFQVLRGAGTDQVVYDPGYLGVQRDDGVVFVQVFLRRGRTDEQKRAFYRALAKHAADAGVEPRNLFVALVENGLGDWSFGNGEAQYLDNPPT
ncbi:tautomerase family protein [Pseudonocardia cypriaca]|uniref:Tautomerase-like protein n=1 Tax=Pseudonocardia cypriaca TaxID=882449 RepID=A0A543FNI9_9PSEU|nr:tautomerase family protein [Pseudonocardia cypriaca]TQM35415.1 tautomerase-like protein [Pseudonocardia cypriaca]